MRTDGKSIVQLVFVPRRFPNRLRANTALGVWQKKPARIEVRSRQTEASRLRKPLARLTTEGVTHVLSEKGAWQQTAS